MKATLEWKSAMTFEAKARQHVFILDSPDLGKDLGPSPKETLIASILGCTGMDVVSLMRKNRIELKSFSLTGNAESREIHPKRFSQIDIVFDLKTVAKDADAELPKILESVELSMTRYCAVSSMVAPTAPIF